jgi:thiamine pyrophosphokinase
LRTIFVVTGGDPVPAAALEGLPSPDLVVAADSGLDHAHALGLRPDIVVGDFDSVSDEALARFDGDLERHPVAKDATDLELALRTAVERNPDRIVVIGGHGGRLDHFLANALVLTTVPTAVEVEWRAGSAEIHVVHATTRLTGDPGEKISLVPVGGTVHGVTTAGLRWPLTDATLSTGSSLGVSNEFAASSAAVTVRDGTLLAIIPGQP